ncbi:hypothetical protein [Williamsia sp. M5A3_1d]
MVVVVALVVAIGVAYLVWRAFGPDTTTRSAPTSSRRGPIGPDDDPDFLLDLGHDRRAPRSPRRDPNGTDPTGDDTATPPTPDADDPRPGTGS